MCFVFFGVSRRIETGIIEKKNFFIIWKQNRGKREGACVKIILIFMWKGISSIAMVNHLWTFSLNYWTAWNWSLTVDFWGETGNKIDCFTQQTKFKRLLSDLDWTNFHAKALKHFSEKICFIFRNNFEKKYPKKLFAEANIASLLCERSHKLPTSRQ